MTALRPPTAPTLPVGTPDLLASIEAAATISARARLLLQIAAAADAADDHEATARHMCEAADLLVKASIALGRPSTGGPTDGGTVGATEAVRKTP